jgi:hypothetical protein
LEYVVELKTDMPVLYVAFLKGFTYSRDGLACSDAAKQVLDSVAGPVYYVLDLRQWKNFTVNELITSTNNAARQGNSNFHHPMSRMVILITDDRSLKLTADGLRHPVYGNTNVQVFSTYEDAVTFIKQDVMSK